MKSWIKKQLGSVSKRAKELLRHGVGIPAGGVAAVLVTVLGGVSSSGGATEETDAALGVLLEALLSGGLTPMAFIAGITVWLLVEKSGKSLTGEDEE